MDWGEALRRTRAGEFDVIDGIVETAERRDYFDFTPAYATIEASIFFRNDISGITDLASLKGFPVGVKAGDQHIEKQRATGVTTVMFHNNDAIIRRRYSGTSSDGPCAKGIRPWCARCRRASRPSAGELKRIDEKWFGRTINRMGRYLTYAGYAAAVAILLIAGLAGWNHALRRRILQRTAALGESEQRFRQIAENIQEVFWLIDVTKQRTLYVSPACEDIWGRTCASLYAAPMGWLDAIHPDDRERVRQAAATQRANRG